MARNRRRDALLRIFKRTKETDEKTEQALERTRKGWFSSISGIFDRGKIDDEVWDELEELLIGADTGVSTTQKILGAVQLRVETGAHQGRRAGQADPQGRSWSRRSAAAPRRAASGAKRMIRRPAGPP